MRQYLIIKSEGAKCITNTPPPPTICIKKSRKKSYSLNLFWTILLIIGATIYTNIEIEAEPFDICYPDCETDLWVPNPPASALVAPVWVCNGTIRLQVRYRTRLACGQYYDLYIEGVGYYPGEEPNLNAALACNAWDIKQLLDEITEQLLITNPMNFPPLTNGCETNWRVMNGSCWKLAANFGGVGSISGESQTYSVDPVSWGYSGPWLQPCPDLECCLERFTVCIENGERVITLSGYQPPSNTEGCTEPDGNPIEPGSRCYPVCGSIYR